MADDDTQNKPVKPGIRGGYWPILVLTTALGVGGHMATRQPALTDEQVSQVEEVINDKRFQGRYGAFLPYVADHDQSVLLLTPNDGYIGRGKGVIPPNQGKLRWNMPSGLILMLEIPKEMVLIEGGMRIPEGLDAEVMRIGRGTVLLGPPRGIMWDHNPGLDTPEALEESARRDLEAGFRARGLEIVVKSARTSHTSGLSVETRGYSWLQKMMDKDKPFPQKPKDHEKQKPPEFERLNPPQMAEIPPRDGGIIRSTRRMRI